MEVIRWKFVTAFGFGAGFALFFIYIRGATPEQTVLIQNFSVAIVIIISIASIFTQLRIYGLVHSAWCRIECLQREEANLVEELYGLRNNLKEAFVFPHVTLPDKITSHLWTVHMATCSTFASFIGLGIAIIFHTERFCPFLIFIISSTAIMGLIWWRSVVYTNLLNKEIE
jgi:hypothetical protein